MDGFSGQGNIFPEAGDNIACDVNEILSPDPLDGRIHKPTHRQLPFLCTQYSSVFLVYSYFIFVETEFIAL